HRQLRRGAGTPARGPARSDASRAVRADPRARGVAAQRHARRQRRRRRRRILRPQGALMSDTTIKNVVEAALLAAGRPLDVDQLKELFDEFARPESADIRGALKTLTAEYEGRGIELKEVASGFRIQVRDAVASQVSRLWQERPQRYSRALLETLALIAYPQPITRREIEDLRGVQVNPNILPTPLH